MSQKEKLYNQIEQYLNGTLPEDQLKELQSRIASNPSLIHEISLHREIQSSLTANEAGSLKKTAQTVVSKRRPTNRRNVRYWPLVAASLLIFLAIKVLVNTNPTPKKLAAEYFVPYDNILFQRSENQLDVLLNEGMNAYQNTHYHKAITYLKKVTATNGKEPYVSLYLGISYLAVEDSKNAISHLKSVSKLDSHTISFIAHWYLALAFLHNGQLKEARSTLKHLVLAKEPYYRIKAQDILDQLP